MASTLRHYFFLLLFFFFISSSSSSSSSSFKPKALVIPVTKYDDSLQYLTEIYQRTPRVLVKLVLDIGGPFLWITCQDKYTSSTYRPAICNSAACKLAGSTTCDKPCFAETPRPGCHNNTCIRFVQNPVDSTTGKSEIAQDAVWVKSTNGSTTGANVAVPRFIFSCTNNFLVLSLGPGAGVSGLAGLGRADKISLPSQFASAFGFHKKFAVCLPSTGSKGAVFFGDGPYIFRPNVNAGQYLTYTPLILNRPNITDVFNRKQLASEYYIGVESIRVNNEVVPINKTLLSINKDGIGGTKISTIHPFTVLEESIYTAVTGPYLKEMAARNISRVFDTVTRFDYCFNKSEMASTRLGPAVPTIEFVLQNNVTWPIFGANLMASWEDENALCLGIDRAQENPTTSIVIGAYQLENNLLEFNLESSRLGFSSSLLGRSTTCGNFDFN